MLNPDIKKIILTTQTTCEDETRVLTVEDYEEATRKIKLNEINADAASIFENVEFS